MIKAILMDCDGVLTDGTYYYSNEGKQLKRFSCIDSKGIIAAQEKSIYVAVISEDSTGPDIGEARCKDMNIEYFRATSPQDKVRIADEILSKQNIKLQECAFIADDIGDLPLLGKAAMVLAPDNATDEVKDFVKSQGGYITKQSGGKGAVREAITWILNQNETES